MPKEHVHKPSSPFSSLKEFVVTRVALCQLTAKNAHRHWSPNSPPNARSFWVICYAQSWGYSSSLARGETMWSSAKIYSKLQLHCEIEELTRDREQPCPPEYGKVHNKNGSNQQPCKIDVEQQSPTHTHTHTHIEHIPFLIDGIQNSFKLVGLVSIELSRAFLSRLPNRESFKFVHRSAIGIRYTKVGLKLSNGGVSRNLVLRALHVLQHRLTELRDVTTRC